MGSNVSHGLVAARRMVAPSRVGVSASCCPPARCLSVECVAHPRGPPDDVDVLRRGPPRPDVLALPEIAAHFNCWEASAQRTSTAAPLWSLSQVGSQPPTGAQANPWSSSTSAPALTHRPIGAGGTAVAEPTDTAADTASPRTTSAAAAARHPRRRGESAAVSLPHAGEPKTAPSCSGIDVASPHQWWRGQHSSPIPGRMEPRSGAQCAAGCGRQAQSGPTSCSTAPNEPRFSDAEIPKPVEFDHGSLITGVVMRDADQAGPRCGAPTREGGG